MKKSIRELEIEVSNHPDFPWALGLLTYPDFKPTQLVRLTYICPRKGWVLDTSDPITHAYLCSLVGGYIDESRETVLSMVLTSLGVGTFSKHISFDCQGS